MYWLLYLPLNFNVGQLLLNIGNKFLTYAFVVTETATLAAILNTLGYCNSTSGRENVYNIIFACNSIEVLIREVKIICFKL